MNLSRLNHNCNKARELGDIQHHPSTEAPPVIHCIEAELSLKLHSHYNKHYENMTDSVMIHVPEEVNCLLQCTKRKIVRFAQVCQLVVWSIHLELLDYLIMRRFEYKTWWLYKSKCKVAMKSALYEYVCGALDLTKNSPKYHNFCQIKS